MGCIPILILLVFGIPTVITVTVNDTSSPISKTKKENLSELPTEASVNVTRKGRGLELDIVELPSASKKTKRQIIKIPANVSKIKFVRPPLNLRHNRAPQQFTRFPQAPRNAQRRPNHKKPQTDNEYDYDFDDSQFYNAKKVKRNLKRLKTKEVTPQVFYDEDFDFENEALNQEFEKNVKNLRTKKLIKVKRKHPKQNDLIEYLTSYEAGRPERPHEDDTFESFNKRHRGAQGEESLYTQDAASSSIHMKQVPPPNLFAFNAISSPEVMKQSYSEKPISNQFLDENYVPGFTINKLPSKGRQIQSLFSQQYTTHNPHVTTNFGLNGFGNLNGYQFLPYGLSTGGKFNQPTVAAASDSVVTSLPVLTPGIQVIQPPQFRDVTVSHPSHPSRLMSPSSSNQEPNSSQKATIRDILEQDCPSHDTKGYCESPPRYPMQQIGNMVKKCASLMEVMNTQPFEEPQDVFAFVRRSDSDLETENKTITSHFGTEKFSSWSRSGNEETTACNSELTITEPGYGREVNSGRWFVIVQHPETTIQRIVTDTCTNAGKTCGGLAGLKCSKINGAPFKSSRCVQRYTYQRLISWDPETPDVCPRIRTFRFPSSCICHLGKV